MAQAIADWYSSAAQQVGEYFQTGAGQVADYYSDALKAADQLTGASGAAKEVARLVCRRYGANPGVVSGAVAANFERLCRPYLDSIDGGEGPVVDLPFRGGQCAARYTVIGDRYSLTTGELVQANQVFAVNQQGPLTFALQGNSPPPGGCTTGKYYPGDRVISATGNSISLSGQGCSAFHPQVRNVRVTRSDGLPDSCGNPPPVFTPPEADPTPEPPGPRPIVVAPGVDIDVDVQIGPESVTIIGLGVGPVVIDPFPEGGGPGGGGPGGGGAPPGDVGSPGDPDDAEPGSPAAGCAPPNSVLAGIKIAILATPAGVNQYDPLVWRGACYVYFGVPGNLALDPSGVALRDGQFFIPPAENLTCYEVRANTGFALRVTPYYRTLEAEQV